MGLTEWNLEEKRELSKSHINHGPHQMAPSTKKQNYIHPSLINHGPYGTTPRREKRAKQILYQPWASRNGTNNKKQNYIIHP
jgi:hypothetical protein